MSSEQVKCPLCGRLSLWSSANPFRPFCSERCKLIDLGAWSSESYRLPVQEEEDSSKPESVD